MSKPNGAAIQIGPTSTSHYRRVKQEEAKKKPDDYESSASSQNSSSDESEQPEPRRVAIVPNINEDVHMSNSNTPRDDKRAEEAESAVLDMEAEIGVFVSPREKPRPPSPTPSCAHSGVSNISRFSDLSLRSLSRDMELKRVPTVGLIQRETSIQETSLKNSLRMAFTTSTAMMYALSVVALVITGVSNCKSIMVPLVQIWGYAQASLWLIGAVLSILLIVFAKRVKIRMYLFFLYLWFVAPITLFCFLFGNVVVLGMKEEFGLVCNDILIDFMFVWTIITWVYVVFGLGAACVVMFKNNALESNEFKKDINII